MELDDLEGMGPTSVITEVGIYRLVLTHDPTQSAALSRWVKQKLLPEVVKLAQEGQ